MFKKSSKRKSVPSRREFNYDLHSFKGGFFNLLDSLGDKDETVRATVENSLIKIADRKTDQSIEALCEYKKKNPKLADPQIAVILR